MRLKNTRHQVEFSKSWVQDSSWIPPLLGVPRMNTGSGQEGSSQRGRHHNDTTGRTLPISVLSSPSASGSAVPRQPHPNGHRHSLSQTAYNSPWDKSDPARIPPSSASPSQNTASSPAPVGFVNIEDVESSDNNLTSSKLGTATGRTKAVARKTTGKFPPRPPQLTPKRPEPPIEVLDSDDSEPDSDPAPLEEIRRRSGQ